MEIRLTQDQINEYLDDKYIDIIMGDYRVYLELNPDNSMWYAEFIKSKDGRTEQGYAFDFSDLEKMKPKRPRDPSYYHNDPLCPNCSTYLIYKFEHCPMKFYIRG